MIGGDPGEGMLTLKPLGKRAIRRARLGFHLLRFPFSKPGSVSWLVGVERKYGGFVTNVPRLKVSPTDPRQKGDLQAGGMTGGDRMFHHEYGPKYSEHLQRFLDKSRVTLVEIGILRGTGIAMWCDLFPEGRVLGLDIDLGHIEGNLQNLEALGGFTKNRPELYEFDQFLDNAEYLGRLLGGDKIDICIDDGFHSVDSILTTLASVIPHLADRFLYIIEDNRTVHKIIREVYPEFEVDHLGELTVLFR
jgi:hypothetical protein